MNVSHFDYRVMRKLLRKATTLRSATPPNPPVVAALTKGEEIIAIGAHAGVGTPHAEVVAIQKAGKKAKGATLYITLEPCTHWGKTPPCTDAIISSGIRRVIFAMSDPNPLVREKDATKHLSKHGIQVDYGVCSEEAERVNEVYLKNMQHNMPFIILKAGMSLDGRIALSNYQSNYITSEASLKEVHKLRSTVDAILVGATTVCQDDPLFTIRYGIKHRRVPKVIILDPHLRIPLTAKLFQDRKKEDIMIVTSHGVASSQHQEKAVMITYPSSPFSMKKIIKKLYQKYQIHTLLIEGGCTVFTQAIEEKCVDKCYFFIAPTLIMDKSSIPVFSGKALTSLKNKVSLNNLTSRAIGPDILIEGYV